MFITLVALKASVGRLIVVFFPEAPLCRDNCWPSSVQHQLTVFPPDWYGVHISEDYSSILLFPLLVPSHRFFRRQQCIRNRGALDAASCILPSAEDHSDAMMLAEMSSAESKNNAFTKYFLNLRKFRCRVSNRGPLVTARALTNSLVLAAAVTHNNATL